jgi:hypothetical protein
MEDVERNGNNYRGTLRHVQGAFELYRIISREALIELFHDT